MTKNEKLVVDAAVPRGEKKVISCAEAFKLSQEHGVSLKEIGDTCNEHGIKIIDCELGCFK